MYVQKMGVTPNGVFFIIFSKVISLVALGGACGFSGLGSKLGLICLVGLGLGDDISSNFAHDLCSDSVTDQATRPSSIQVWEGFYNRAKPLNPSPKPRTLSLTFVAKGRSRLLTLGQGT